MLTHLPSSSSKPADAVCANCNSFPRSKRDKTSCERLARAASATVATDQEVLRWIEREALAGLGIAYIDAHLLASSRLTQGCRIWTRDKRLPAISERLHLNAIVGS